MASPRLGVLAQVIAYVIGNKVLIYRGFDIRVTWSQVDRRCHFSDFRVIFTKVDQNFSRRFSFFVDICETSNNEISVQGLR